MQYRSHCQTAETAIRQERQKQAIKQDLQAAILRPWQKWIKRAMEEPPHNRRVYWIWDNVGNMGKSWIATYFAVMMDAFVTSNGKSADIKYGYTGQKIVIFDHSRSQKDQINYHIIEELKDGRFFNTKYESAMRIYRVPRVICFANYPPDQTKLSNDKWCIKDLSLTSHFS